MGILTRPIIKYEDVPMINTELSLKDLTNQSKLTHVSNIFSFSLFFKQEMELSLVGLQNAGKTSLVNSIAVCINSYNLSYATFFSLLS